MKLFNSFFLLATFIFLFSCSNDQTQNIEIKGNAMGTFYFIKMIDVPNKLEKDKLKLELNKTFLEINKAELYLFLLFMSVFSKSLFSLVSRHLMSFSFFTAWHNKCFLIK